MQSKIIIALALSFLSTFVAASPVPVPVPAPAPAGRDRFKLPRFESLAREDSSVAREEVDVEEREPAPICQYDCI